MKVLCLWLVILTATAAEIIDLGVVSELSVIRLERPGRRADFVGFEVQISRRGNTNKVNFTTTNYFLSITNLVTVPEGRSVLGVRSKFADGTVSAWKLSRIDVQRGPEEPPQISKATILANHTFQDMDQL